jgi:hypothetical protein
MSGINERMSEDEYKSTYIESDYYKDTQFDSLTIDNWLNDDELKIFKDAGYSEDSFKVRDTAMAPLAKFHYDQDPEEHLTANYMIFSNFYDDPKWSHLVDIIQPKLEKTFGNGIYASHIHLLDSHFPYGLHNDAEQSNMKIAPHPAWTLIVPLDDYDSTTYVFKERSGVKDPVQWATQNNIPRNEDMCVSREIYERDFAPITSEEPFHYLTVDSTFKWKKGSCFAADRYKYHCSDNFFNHSVNSKQAIIMWTSRK